LLWTAEIDAEVANGSQVAVGADAGGDLVQNRALVGFRKETPLFHLAGYVIAWMRG
jgi:hypothetical protein